MMNSQTFPSRVLQMVLKIIRNGTWMSPGSPRSPLLSELMLEAGVCGTRQHSCGVTLVYGVLSACWSPLGDLILTGSIDCTARVWFASSGDCKLARICHTGQVASVAFAPDGNSIVNSGHHHRWIPVSLLS